MHPHLDGGANPLTHCAVSPTTQELTARLQDIAAPQRLGPPPLNYESYEVRERTLPAKPWRLVWRRAAAPIFLGPDTVAQCRGPGALSVPNW